MNFDFFVYICRNFIINMNTIKLILVAFFNPVVQRLVIVRCAAKIRLNSGNSLFDELNSRLHAQTGNHRWLLPLIRAKPPEIYFPPRRLDVKVVEGGIRAASPYHADANRRQINR